MKSLLLILVNHFRFVVYYFKIIAKSFVGVCIVLHDYEELQSLCVESLSVPQSNIPITSATLLYKFDVLELMMKRVFCGYIPIKSLVNVNESVRAYLLTIVPKLRGRITLDSYWEFESVKTFFASLSDDSVDSKTFGLFSNSALIIRTLLKESERYDQRRAELLSLFTFEGEVFFQNELQKAFIKSMEIIQQDRVLPVTEDTPHPYGFDSLTHIILVFNVLLGGFSDKKRDVILPIMEEVQGFLYKLSSQKPNRGNMSLKRVPSSTYKFSPLNNFQRAI